MDVYVKVDADVNYKVGMSDTVEAGGPDAHDAMRRQSCFPPGLRGTGRISPLSRRRQCGRQLSLFACEWKRARAALLPEILLLRAPPSVRR